MLTKANVFIHTANCPDGASFTNVELRSHPASRAMRLVDDSTRFLLISVSKKANERVLRQNMARWMQEGVVINGVHYRYFGYTEGQLKAGKLMFFREGQGWTVHRLLSDFGNLSAVYLKAGYGKYSARLGLSFSSTVESLDIPHELALRIPDLPAPDGSLHSDGCGMIRDSFAAKVCAQHSLPSDTTVFQIRRGGIKGLLVRYPDDRFERLCMKHTQRRSACMIAYRPSMYKYEGGPTVLELNNHNFPPPSAHLNVQFTALLLTLGVPYQVFERLVQDQLDLIGSILHDREKALLYVKGELDAAAEDSYVQGLYAMLLAQQDLFEPTVRQKLQSFQKIQYDSLRAKLHLRIPDSAYLLGIVDEDGVLRPNEVYINLPSRSGVLVRDVVVARSLTILLEYCRALGPKALEVLNGSPLGSCSSTAAGCQCPAAMAYRGSPSHHPGDFRKLRAVDHPALRHHRNCIVFSSTGPHSVPDTMASGDLDGDRYFVTWDPSLLPPSEAPPLKRGLSATAAEQADAHRSSVARQLSDMHMAGLDTFLQLKFNRLLGMMSNEWTRQVEKAPEIANAPFLRELTPLIESALDMLKSGEDFVRLEAQFKALQRRYSNRNTNGYHGPIQRLRDMVPERDSEPKKKLDGNQCDASLILRDEDPVQWIRHLTDAARIMPLYNGELTKAINIDKSASDYESDSRFEKDEQAKHADRVKQKYQQDYFGGGGRVEREEQRMRASAWYYHGYMKNKPSFSWLGERYLNEIKAWSSNGNRPPLFVGAALPRSPAASTSLSRLDSQTTLVDEASQPAPEVAQSDSDIAMDITPDDIIPLRKAGKSSDCPNRHRGAEVGVSTIADTKRRLRPRCSKDVEPTEPAEPSEPSIHPVPHYALVAANPKPRVPVASQYNLPCPVDHEWNVVSANGFARKYLCKYCGVEIHEKKNGGYWVTESISTGVRRPDNHTPPQPRHLRERLPDTLAPDEMPASLMEMQELADANGDTSDDAMSVYESATENISPSPLRERAPSAGPPRRPSAGRASRGTASSEAPSSLVELSSLRRLPTQPGVDVSSPIGRPRQATSRRTSRTASGFRIPTPAPDIQSESSQSNAHSQERETAPQRRSLVSENPKPLAPVAAHITPQCRGGTVHSWKVDWANGTHRRYKCRTCDHIVKERKFGTPQHWVSAD